MKVDGDMGRTGHYHQATNKKPIQNAWDYLVDNGPAPITQILDHLVTREPSSGRYRKGMWNGMTSQSLTGIICRNLYYFRRGDKDERVPVTYYGDGQSKTSMDVWHARPLEEVVKRIVSSGRPMAKFPAFFREAVYKAYPECPENWDASPDSPFWVTVKKVRREVLLSK